jgi:peptidoglycan L-alanyl-D-glutamate endopeptidase CwlK
MFAKTKLEADLSLAEVKRLMASRNLNDCRPDVAEKVKLLIKKCDDVGIDLLVTCTYRSNEEQNKLYAQGRTTAGKIVTNAKAGQSLHNKTTADGKPASQAVDVVIIENGKCVWDTKDPRWKRVGEIGKACGLEWAGDWVSFKEYPHFQVK